MLVITPFTVIVESGMNSAVSEWCAAAGTASSARANAASATFDGVFIGFCPLTPLTATRSAPAGDEVEYRGAPAGSQRNRGDRGDHPLFLGARYRVSVTANRSIADARNFRCIDESLLTAGQPNEEQLEDAARQGVKVVVNLALHDDPRYSLRDEAGSVRALWMAYGRIPVQV